MDFYSAGSTIVNYAAKGGMIAAGGGMLLISLATAVDLLRQPTAERLLVVLGNYFVIGAVIGGVVGLGVILHDYRQR